MSITEKVTEALFTFLYVVFTINNLTETETSEHVGENTSSQADKSPILQFPRVICHSLAYSF